MLRRLTFVSAAVLIVAGPAQAQNVARVRAESLVTAARASARAGDTSEAISLANQARRVDRNYADGHFLHGQLLARSTSMGFTDLPLRQLAERSLNRAIELAGEDPWAIIELGHLRLKMPFLRIAAEQLFQRALRAAERKGDPDAIAEVRYELGRIYDLRYRGYLDRYEFLGDVSLLNPYEAQYDKHYVDNFLANYARPIPESGEFDGAKAEEHYRAALAIRRGHESAAAAYSSILYESGRYAEMQRITHAAGIESPSSARVRLAEGLALLNLGQYAKANEVFVGAIALLSDRERQMIASIAPLMKTDAARQYEALDASAKTSMERIYWDAADPMLLTGMNEYYLAFLGRVAYADLFFSMPERGIRGALTDRGQIALRYGAPPVRAVFAPDVADRSGMGTVANLTTLWLYPQPKLKFIFQGPPAMDGAWFAGDFRGYANEVREAMPVLFHDLPWAPVMDTIPIQIARFRGDQPWNTRVEFHAAMPMPHLVLGSDLKAVPVETAFIIRDGTLGSLVDARDTATVQSDSVGIRHRTWDRQFRPGEYGYRVEAFESQSMRGARASGAMSLVSFPTESFGLSDVLVGKGMSLEIPEPKRRSDVRMDVVADNSLNPGEPLTLYWETYGAKASAERTIKLDVEISLTVLELTRATTLHTRILGGLADRLGVSAEGERTVTQKYSRTTAAPVSTDDRLVHTITLDLGGAPPAQYLLELKMTDTESGQVARTSRVFYIRRPQ